MMNDDLRLEIEDDGHDPDAVQAWAEYVGEDVTEWDRPTRESFEDCYEGEWNSFTDYVQQTCCDVGLGLGGVYLDGNQVSDFFLYIDWDQVEHDWECSGEFYEHEIPHSCGRVYVFRAV